MRAEGEKAQTMEDLCDSNDALKIIEQWGWDHNDYRFEIDVPVMLSLSNVINRLAMEGHRDPPGAVLSLLADGRLVSTGSYRWTAHRKTYFEREGIGQIPIARWLDLKQAEDEPRKHFKPKVITFHLLSDDSEPKEQPRSVWNWQADRFSTNKVSGGFFLDIDYAEDSFNAADIELRPANVDAVNPNPDNLAAGLNYRNKGGAPAKYDWAQAVAAVVFQWADNGTWHPARQSEVKARLSDWFAEREQHPSESLLKEHARWLFAEFERRSVEANNIPA